MAVEEIVTSLVIEVGRIGKWLQALGVLVVFWLGFQIYNFILNRKKWNTIKEMDKKLDKLLKK